MALAMSTTNQPNEQEVVQEQHVTLNASNPMQQRAPRVLNQTQRKNKKGGPEAPKFSAQGSTMPPPTPLKPISPAKETEATMPNTLTSHFSELATPSKLLYSNQQLAAKLDPSTSRPTQQVLQPTTNGDSYSTNLSLIPANQNPRPPNPDTHGSASSSSRPKGAAAQVLKDTGDISTMVTERSASPLG